MPRYRLQIEYEGTRYSGWQVQKGARTIQGALIEAARRAFGEVGELSGSGRTDAGVHALSQIAHADLLDSHPPDRVKIGLNDNLPHDINIVSIRTAHRGFHARHDAICRSYLYQISRRRTAFGKPFVWWVRDRLDMGAMRRAALSVVGLHDFASFTDQRPDEGGTRVSVEEVMIGEFDDLVVVRVRASHFLRKMVRRLVGTLAEIGRGAIPVTAISDALEAPLHGTQKQTAPPSGLFLEGVAYPGEPLPQQLAPAFVIGRREP